MSFQKDPVPQPQPQHEIPPAGAEGQALGEIERQLYGHVRDAIDFCALYQLEQLLSGMLDLRGIDDETGELANTMIVDAAVRAICDPASYCAARPPPGITEAEARAVEFDDACPFCKMEAAQAASAASDCDADLDAELVELHAEAARSWRAQHADVLKRHGLG